VTESPTVLVPVRLPLDTEAARVETLTAALAPAAICWVRVPQGVDHDTAAAAVPAFFEVMVTATLPATHRGTAVAVTALADGVTTTVVETVRFSGATS
jgi:hypothetical protein